MRLNTINEPTIIKHYKPMTSDTLQPANKPNILLFDEARNRMLHAARAATLHEKCTLALALGRVLAIDVFSPINVPGFDNSAMDGYALHVGDFAQVNTVEQAKGSTQVSVANHSTKSDQNKDLAKPVTSFKVVQRITAGQVGVALAARQRCTTKMMMIV
jgi:molybdopterin biosynthesis enzyme